MCVRGFGASFSIAWEILFFVLNVVWYDGWCIFEPGFSECCEVDLKCDSLIIVILYYG